MKRKKLLPTIAFLFAMMLPVVSMAQAHCYILAGTTTQAGGLELHVEYWCCTGPEGCFWDIYVL